MLQALAAGPRDTIEIAVVTGIPKPGGILHTLLIERRVRRVGTRPAGRRPAVIWALEVQ